MCNTKWNYNTYSRSICWPGKWTTSMLNFGSIVFAVFLWLINSVRRNLTGNYLSSCCTWAQSKENMCPHVFFTLCSDMGQHGFHNPTATFIVVYDFYDSLHDCFSSLGRTMYENVCLNMAAAQFSQCKLLSKASFCFKRKSHWKTNGRIDQICQKSSKFCI